MSGSHAGRGPVGAKSRFHEARASRRYVVGQVEVVVPVLRSWEQLDAATRAAITSDVAAILVRRARARLAANTAIAVPTREGERS
jgi:hypothetical protein